MQGSHTSAASLACSEDLARVGEEVSWLASLASDMLGLRSSKLFPLLFLWENLTPLRPLPILTGRRGWKTRSVGVGGSAGWCLGGLGGLPLFEDTAKRESCAAVGCGTGRETVQGTIAREAQSWKMRLEDVVFEVKLAKTR